ncbi:TNT domain-containing protein [Streptomyces sp. NA02950]|uniref:TNT domain-containing protein n=1 Tax=Streptomyces sp. NA02950 TaxID=2742137 RepID=UPI001591867D|nr:TNT domain-containing protein [Streptomyces sp. NA02950]QKV93695.1 TNT domain-containing protein [Streptomyces sp. NA02950]
MRVLRHVLVVLGSLLLLCSGGSAVAQPAAGFVAMGLVPAAPAGTPSDQHSTGSRPSSGSSRPVPCPTRDRVGGTNMAPGPAQQRYFQGDWRLGPAYLPRTGAIGRMLEGYQRLDGYRSSAAFLDCYWNERTGGWWYPYPDGWTLLNGEPLKTTVTLRAGQKVDLFGSGFGHFLAPAGTPYTERALPPGNLNTLDPDYPFGYHLYRVTKPFLVEAGPIRPWFGQPGQGLQYLTGPSIPQLVAAGNLTPLN